MAAQRLFKFVHLRGVPDRGVLRPHHFVISDRDADESEVLEEASSDASPDRRSAAEEFMESEDFIPNLASMTADQRRQLKRWINVLDNIEEGETVGDVASTILSQGDDDEEDTPFEGDASDTATAIRALTEEDWIPQLERQLWDSVYASIYLRRESQVNIREITAVLRAIAVLRHWPEDASARFKNPDALRNLQLRVPTTLFPEAAHRYEDDRTLSQQARDHEEAAVDRKKKLFELVAALVVAARVISKYLQSGAAASEGKVIAKRESDKPARRGFFSRRRGKEAAAPGLAENFEDESPRMVLEVGAAWNEIPEEARDQFAVWGFDDSSDAVALLGYAQARAGELFSALAALSTLQETLRHSRVIAERERRVGKDDPDIQSTRPGKPPSNGSPLDEPDGKPGHEPNGKPGRPHEPPHGPFDPCDFSALVMPVGCVRPIGIGDLNIVEQRLIRYVPSEIAHIENILTGEERSRTHRRLDRTETTLFTSAERTAEKLEDLKSTERFEMEREVEQTLQSRMSVEGGLTISGAYGSVDFSANVAGAYESSTESRTRQSVQYASEITEEARSRVEERVREDRTLVTIREIEETNLHKLENDDEEHVSGMYFWVSKEYCAQVRNYGKRLFMEFVVPEPASFYRHVFTPEELKGVGIEPPEDPGDLRPDDITLWNYNSWAAKYGVQNIAPPPVEWIYHGESFGNPAQGTPALEDSTFVKASKFAEIDEGYVLRYGAIIPQWVYIPSFSFSYSPTITRGIYAAVLNRRYYWIETTDLTTGDVTSTAHLGWLAYFEANEESKEIPYWVMGLNTSYTAVNLLISLQCSQRKFEEWRINTWKEIINAYASKKADYDAAVRAAEIAQGVEISGRNPLQNRSIEKNELQRLCLHLLTSWNFLGFGSVMNDVPPHGYPEMNTYLAMWNARIVQFFEQAFEWNQMTYVFYPYFWARKSEWPTFNRNEDSDWMFQRFLQAGSARVLVPVRPRYEAAVGLYLRTGRLWNGGDIPGIDDDLFVSVVDEFVEEHGLLTSVPVGPPWRITVPTSLVTLRPDILPTWENEVACEDVSEPEPEMLPDESAEAEIVEGLTEEARPIPGTSHEHALEESK